MSATIIFSTLTGCSVFLPVKLDEEKKFVINSVPAASHVQRKHVSLYVEPIDSSAIYNTTAMAYTKQPYQVSYFVKNSWADTPANMLRPLVVQAFENTHAVWAGHSSIAINYNYVLSMQLLQLQQDFYHSPTTLHLIMRAQLLSGATNKVIAEKEFLVDEVMVANTPYSGVVAANSATQEFLRQLTRFCLSHM